MIKQAAFIMIVTIVTCSQSQAAQCTGSEGVTPNLEWNITWKKNGPSIANKKERWSVSQTLGLQAKMTADLDLTRTKDTLSAKKTNVTDGNPCVYIGDIKGGSVTGTYTCKTGGPYKFVLTCDWQ